MKNAEFVALVMANANKTRNIRTYAKKWFSGARRLQVCVLNKIGHVIALIQAQIYKGKMINGLEEYLLVYNFQPLSCDTENTFFLTLDMMIRPIARIDDTQTLEGKPIQFVVEAVSGEVMNNAKAMQLLGVLDLENLEGESPPESYGNFNDYNATSGFAALEAEAASIQLSLLFEGNMDNSPVVQQCVAFDCVEECREYLASKGISDGWAVELSLPKEDLPIILANGFCHYAVKFISYECATVSPRPECFNSEAKVEDQLHLLTLARQEAPTIPEEEVLHPKSLQTLQVCPEEEVFTF